MPPPAGETEAAADLIGQGKVLASPMAMASVAASVAAGRTVLPHLLDEYRPEADPAMPLTADEAAAAARADARGGHRGVGRPSWPGVPGEVGAKTGTAEYGTPGSDGAAPGTLPTHAWMIATRGDLAVAVFVETGVSGSQTRGPAARCSSSAAENSVKSGSRPLPSAVGSATLRPMTFLTRLPARPTTLDEPLAHWAQADPDGEAVRYGERRWTWAEWNDRVRRAAGGLRALGVEKGDVVAFLDKNHPACVEITLAAGSIGAAHAIVNWRSAGDEVDYAVNDCGAKVLFVGTELMPTIEGIRGNLTTVKEIVTVTPDGAEGDEYEAWLAASEPLDRPDEHLHGRRLPGDVQLRHHRTPEGGHADPRQHDRAHRQRPRGLGVRGRRQVDGRDAAVRATSGRASANSARTAAKLICQPGSPTRARVEQERPCGGEQAARTSDRSGRLASSATIAAAPMIPARWIEGPPPASGT